MRKIKRIKIKDQDEADMGISTMIIFIAVVLVGAVAAGLLIDVANLVQQQAQTTGIRAIEGVASGYKVLDRIGDRANETGVLQSTIQRIYIKITINAGSPGMDMNATLVSVTDAEHEVTLNFTATGGPTATRFNATELRDPLNRWADSGLYIVSEGSVVTICVDANATGLSLSPSTPVTVRIIPRYGPTSLEQFTVPESFTYRYVDFY